MDTKNLLLAVGFEDAFLDVSSSIATSHRTVAVYDRAKCIEILMSRDEFGSAP